MTLLITIGLLLLSIAIIWRSSDWLTDSLIPVAEKFGTSYIAITTILVSFFLSLPEIFSTIYSYLLGQTGIGVGVILGSVMTNIGLVVGLSATIKPLHVEKPVIVRDGIFLIIMTFIIMLFGSDLQFQRAEGIVLLLLFIPYALNVWSFEKWRPIKSRKKQVKSVEQSLKFIGHWSLFKLKPSALTFFISALVLAGGSYLFAFSLVRLQAQTALPALFVGIVFGAIGTGLPNIAAAVQGTIKGYKDVAITESLGSNIFTLLVTFGILITLAPVIITDKVFYFDITWMMVMSLLFVALVFKGYYYREESITRYEGILLLLFYLALLALNVILF